MKLFKCSVCNYIHEGEHAPEVCPKCGADSSKFTELDEAQTKKVKFSDETNDLLMKFIGTVHELLPLCEKGIEINLDPGCLNFFKKAKESLQSLKQNAKAEIETHVSRGKW